MRIVFDTASFITAVRSPGGAAREVLRRILLGNLVPLMDYKLAAEYRDVALQPEHLIASRLSEADMLVLIQALEALSESVDVILRHRPLSPDPADDMVLDLAINGDADALVTSNIKHFLQPGKRFGVPVLSPAQLLQTIRKGK